MLDVRQDNWGGIFTKNVVISNVALEFYEEKTEKYFVLGVHMMSRMKKVVLLQNGILKNVD